MDQLAGVLFNMDAQDADASAVGQLDIAVLTQRLVILRDLVRLRKVGVAVVLAVHLRDLGDLTMGRQTRHDSELDDLFVQLRQGTGQADTYRTAVSVRLAAERGGAGAEYLGLGL